MTGIRKHLILAFCVILTGQILPAQEITDPEELFSEGEFFFLAEEYEEALYFYRTLLQHDPDNANFNYKVGNTLMQIAGQEQLAIPYFEKAIERTSIKYKKRSFKEKNAPHRAFYDLGDAYRMNNELQKALEIYQVFTESDDFEGNYNLNLVEGKIKSCERAKIIQDVPIDASFTRLEDPVNTPANNSNAVLSGDGKTMVFVTQLAFYDAIHLSRHIDGAWTEPEVLNPQVGSDGDLYPTSLSFDGRELFMVKRTENDDDIYVSELGDPFWSKARMLNENINTRTHETHASISADNRTLYFTSDRRGGQGGMDIYMSERQEGGDWGPAVNLGPMINTSLDEETPFPTDDGKRLYFSSQGHFNMGGFDIFYADLIDGMEWSDPINAGFPLNTTSDDLFYYPIGNGNEGYYARADREGPLTFDIYQVRIRDRRALQPLTREASRFEKEFQIELIDPETSDTLIIYYNRDKDLFVPSDPAIRINIREKKK
jgi:hypothetical protein